MSNSKEKKKSVGFKLPEETEKKLELYEDNLPEASAVGAVGGAVGGAEGGGEEGAVGGAEGGIPLPQQVEMEMDAIHREDAILNADPNRKSVLEEELSASAIEELVEVVNNTSMRMSARDRARKRCLVRRKSVTIVHSPYPSPATSPVSDSQPSSSLKPEEEDEEKNKAQEEEGEEDKEK